MTLFLPPLPVAPPPPVSTNPPGPPKVGDIFYRAFGHVFDTGEDHRTISITYEEFVVLSTTRCRMRITARSGLLQPWECLPGQDLGPDYLALTPEDLASRLEHREVRVSGHDSVRMYAWPTKELALESLRIRTDRRVGHRQRDLEHVLALQEHLRSATVEADANNQFTFVHTTRR